ncbi:hepatoma-derived growth factor-like [Drosophila persimilis]|uniref:hepatoma-derived growth factor-like n=2 Tax=Drosophila persimilis TaxID=7234 RepID=UPI000F09103B|nr:hepatoma-derived growth factor-like [Drosophila persimilis]
MNSLSKMAKQETSKSFKIGDLVFAKVRGYKPWPAVITHDVNRKKQYTVSFYGSGQIGYILLKNLTPYLKLKEEYSTEHHLKQADFRRAMIEIDEVAEKATTVQQETANNQKQSHPANDKENDMLLLYMPPSKVFGININYNKPKRFENAAAEQSWMDESRKEANLLKLQLLSGQKDPRSLPGRVVAEPSSNETTKQEEVKLREEIKKQETAMFIERDLIQLTAVVRCCLNQRRANVSRCFTNLKLLKKLDVTKLMLLRNPQSVETIRSMRRYVGNLNVWKMDASDEAAFNAQAKIIRQKATIIYERFQTVLNLAEGEDFWPDFCNEVKIYKANTKNINPNLRNAMDEATYYNLVEAKQGNTPAPAKE